MKRLPLFLALLFSYCQLSAQFDLSSNSSNNLKFIKFQNKLFQFPESSISKNHFLLDPEEQLDSIVFFDIDENNEYINKGRMEYYYGADWKLSTVYERYQPPNDSNNLKAMLTFNDYGNVDTIAYYYWIDNIHWNLFKKKEFGYDTMNNILTITKFSRHNDTWQKQYKKEFFYEDFEILDSTIEFTGINNEWNDSLKYEFEYYDELRLINCYQYLFVENEWKYTERIHYFYSYNTNTISYYKIEGLNDFNYKKIEYRYIYGKLDYIDIYYWEDYWVLYDRYDVYSTYEGSLIDIYHYQWNNEGSYFIPVNYYHLTYDETQTIDDLVLPLGYDGNEFFKQFYKYAKVTNIYCSEPEEKQRGWSLKSLKHFYYSTITTTDTPDRQGKKQYLIYPNPVNEKLSIVNHSTTPITLVELLSLDGKILLSEVYSGNESKMVVDTKNLPPGLFILRINKTKNQRFIKKYIFSTNLVEAEHSVRPEFRFYVYSSIKKAIHTLIK